MGGSASGRRAGPGHLDLSNSEPRSLRSGVAISREQVLAELVLGRKLARIRVSLDPKEVLRG